MDIFRKCYEFTRAEEMIEKGYTLTFGRSQR